MRAFILIALMLSSGSVLAHLDDCDVSFMEVTSEGHCASTPHPPQGARFEHCLVPSVRYPDNTCHLPSDASLLSQVRRLRGSFERTREIDARGRVSAASSPAVIGTVEAPVPTTEVQVRTSTPAVEEEAEVSPVVEAPVTANTEVASAPEEAAGQEGMEDVFTSYNPDSCEWVDDMPRKVHHSPGCGRGGVKTCVGYVVCNQRDNQDLKFVRTATCRSERCGESDAKDCVKDKLFSSVKAQGEELNYMSNRARQLILSPRGAARSE